MSRTLRIAVADDEQEMVDFLKEVLPRMGHEVVIAVSSGRELVEACRNESPDLVITDIRMPDLDGINAAAEIYRHGPVPVILVSAYHDTELVERAGSEHILAYLVKPIKQAHLGPAINIALQRFEQLRTLEAETTQLRQELCERKRVERAKGILMKRANMDERTAFQRLQKLASQHNKKLSEIAEMIITADEALHG
jgi:two-component system, response regulator PdtaR